MLLIIRDDVTNNKQTAYVAGLGIRSVNGVPYYTHKDHLGSPIAMTDSAVLYYGESCTPALPGLFRVELIHWINSSG